MEVSRYLKSCVQTSVKAETIAESSNNETNFLQRLEEETFITSSVTLSGLEFTEEYHDKRENCWYCVAYLKRNDAWNLLLPKIEKSKTEFYALYNRGLEEKEPVLRYSFFVAAMDKGIDFQNVLDYARIIHSKNELEYSSDRDVINSVINLLITEKNKCTLFLDVKGDYGNILTEMLTNIFIESFFSLVGSETSANYKAIVVVDDNKIGDKPFSVLPTVKIEIRSLSGYSIYINSFNSESKTTSYSLEKAHRKSYTKIAEIMAQEVPKNLSKIIYKTEK